MFSIKVSERITLKSKIVIFALAISMMSGCGIIPLLTPNHPDSASPPGTPHSFDAFSVLPEVQQFAGPGSKLVSIRAEYVRSDGTADTTNQREYAEYVFVRPLAPNERDPSAVMGTSDWKTDMGRIVVRLGAPEPELGPDEGLYATLLMPIYWSKGMFRKVGSWSDTKEELASRVVAAPACTQNELWSRAIAEGVPANAVAEIFYNNRGFRLNVSGTEYEVYFDLNCKPLPKGPQCQIMSNGMCVM
jgi:hypothetical protein